jgi:hypothetical protein
VFGATYKEFGTIKFLNGKMQATKMLAKIRVQAGTAQCKAKALVQGTQDGFPPLLR